MYPDYAQRLALANRSDGIVRQTKDVTLLGGDARFKSWYARSRMWYLPPDPVQEDGTMYAPKVPSPNPPLHHHKFDLVLQGVIFSCQRGHYVPCPLLHPGTSTTPVGDEG